VPLLILDRRPQPVGPSVCASRVDTAGAAELEPTAAEHVQHGRMFGPPAMARPQGKIVGLLPQPNPVGLGCNSRASTRIGFGLNSAPSGWKLVFGS